MPYSWKPPQEQPKPLKPFKPMGERDPKGAVMALAGISCIVMAAEAEAAGDMEAARRFAYCNDVLHAIVTGDALPEMPR